MAFESEVIGQANQAGRHGDSVTARAMLVALLRQEPRNANAWLALAEWMDQRPDKARCLQQALQIQPHLAGARTRLARIKVSAPGSVLPDRDSSQTELPPDLMDLLPSLHSPPPVPVVLAPLTKLQSFAHVLTIALLLIVAVIWLLAGLSSFLPVAGRIQFGLLVGGVMRVTAGVSFLVILIHAAHRKQAVPAELYGSALIGLTLSGSEILHGWLGLVVAAIPIHLLLGVLGYISRGIYPVDARSQKRARLSAAAIALFFLVGLSGGLCSMAGLGRGKPFADDFSTHRGLSDWEADACKAYHADGMYHIELKGPGGPCLSTYGDVYEGVRIDVDMGSLLLDGISRTGQSVVFGFQNPQNFFWFGAPGPDTEWVLGWKKNGETGSQARHQPQSDSPESIVWNHLTIAAKPVPEGTLIETFIDGEQVHALLEQGRVSGVVGFRVDGTEAAHAVYDDLKVEPIADEEPS